MTRRIYGRRKAGKNCGITRERKKKELVGRNKINVFTGQ
jgi:hypothetical protein